MRAGLRRTGWAPAAVLLALLPLTGVSPQQTAPAPTSPLLPSDHWSLAALTRAEALGLLPPEYLPAQRAVPRAVVSQAFRAAVGRASGPDAELVRRWVERFEDEFPEASDAAGRPVNRLGLTAGWADGSVPPTTSGGEGSPVLVPLDTGSGLRAAADLTIYAAASFAFDARVLVQQGGPELPTWNAVLGLGAWDLSVGRSSPGFGFGTGGGVTLSGSQAADMLQLQTRSSVRLPGKLAGAGPVAFQFFLGRLHGEAHVGDPHVWGMSGYWEPHPRFTLGLHRAAIFGSSEIEPPTTAKTLGRMLIGITSDGYDNQIVSGSGRYRLPTDRVLPLTAYLEWGADDTAGALVDAPGFVLGALAPAIPGLQPIGLGGEYAYFGVLCNDCRRIAEPLHWYSHFKHTGGWTAGGAPLGHPLGGNGTEARIYAQADLLSGRVQARLAGFHRDRTTGNLFNPTLAGTSRGYDAVADAWLWSRTNLRFSVDGEHGDGWMIRNLTASLSYRF